MSWCESARATRHNRDVANDDLRSVRIEVEDASDSAVEAPRGDDQLNRLSRWPIATVAILVVGLVTALFVLSPDGDEAADGTERTAPTTTTPDVGSTTDDASALDESVVNEAEPEPEQVSVPVLPADPVVPVEADAILTFGQILETSDGFIAMVAEQTLDRPRLARSSDGLEWDDIDTTVTLTSGEGAEGLNWIRLFETNNGFEILVSTDGPQFDTEIASSTDAVSWTLGSDPASALLGPFGEPISVNDDSINAVRFELQPIEQVLQEFTDVRFIGPGVCQVRRTPAAEVQLELFSCTDGERQLLNASNVVAGADAEGVIDCVSSLGNLVEGPTVSFVEVDRIAGVSRALGGESSRWSPTSFPTALRLGGIAFIDAGIRGSEICEPFIALDPPRGPSIVILDAEVGREGIFALPVELDNGSGSGSLFGVEVVGETREFADRSPHLLVTIGQQLWSLNTTWGEWTLVYDTTEDAVGSRLGSLTLSTDGNRLYHPTSEGLRIIELDENADGVLVATARLAPLDAPINFAPESFHFSDLNHASNDLVLLTDSSGRLWSIEVPLPSDERQLEFAEDQGGVGVARVR